MSESTRFLVILLVIVGVLAIIAGAIYVAEPAHSIPSFFPGHIAGATRHHTKRGIAGIVLGVILLLGGWLIARFNRRQAHRYY